MRSPVAALLLLALCAPTASQSPPQTASPSRVPICTAGESADCIDTVSCQANLGGSTYDLSALKKSGSEAPWQLTATDNYNYYMNICDQIAQQPSGCTYNSVQQFCNDGTGCAAYQTTADGAFCYAMGVDTSMTATFLDPAGARESEPESGLTLTWSARGLECDRFFNVRLICDPSESPGKPGSIQEVSDCQYQVQWASATGCNSALSWGWTFFILFDVALLLYCGGGYAYNVRKEGADMDGDITQGEAFNADAVPQWEYWTQLPDLVKDGETTSA